MLIELIKERGPSADAYAILGRVYKGLWREAQRSTDTCSAKRYLERAVEFYLKGFEADWRDPYPGINVVTLMEISNPPDPRRYELLPVVTYACEHRIAPENLDYWDHATRLELAVLAKDEVRSRRALADLLIMVREPWAIMSTAENLKAVREARESRDEIVRWAGAIEEDLSREAEKDTAREKGD